MTRHPLRSEKQRVKHRSEEIERGPRAAWVIRRNTGEADIGPGIGEWIDDAVRGNDPERELPDFFEFAVGGE